MRRYRRIVIGIASALLALVLLVGLGVVATLPTMEPLGVEPLGEEMVGWRSRTSKLYDLGSGQYATDISMGAVHYRDEFRDWQEIDNEWFAAAAPWDWEMLEDGYHTHVVEDFTAGQILLFESQGESVAFQPMALQWTNDLDQIGEISMPQSVSASVSNTPVELLPGMTGSTSKIEWANGYGSGRHFEWGNSPGRLSKLLTLDGSLPTPPSFIINGGNPVLRLNFIFDPSDELDIYVDDVLWDKSSDEQTFNTIEFTLGDKVVWGFMPTAYWDSNEGYGVGLTELRKVGNSLYVSVRVPYEWLQTATYPVYIDPTLDLQVGASLDDGYEKESDGVMNVVGNEVHHQSNTSTLRFWGAHRWTGVDISEGATIDVAYVELYAWHSSADDMNGNFHFQKVVSPVAFTTDAYDITTRDRTTASVSWIANSMGVGWHESPSLVTPLQEVISDYSPTALVLIFRPNQDAAKTYQSTSYDSNDTLCAKLHIEYTAASNTLLLQVAADLDDVHEDKNDGDVHDEANYLIHYSSSTESLHSYMGHRWVSGSLPSQGDTIDECYIQLYCYQTGTDDLHTSLHFEELVAPAQFTAGDDEYDVTSRDRTETSVAWDDDSMGIGWHQSPELKTALQEVLDNYSPTALVLIMKPDLSGGDQFNSRPHNYDSALAARIFIKWTPGAPTAGYSYGTIIG